MSIKHYLKSVGESIGNKEKAFVDKQAANMRRKKAERAKRKKIRKQVQKNLKKIEQQSYEEELKHVKKDYLQDEITAAKERGKVQAKTRAQKYKAPAQRKKRGKAGAAPYKTQSYSDFVKRRTN